MSLKQQLTEDMKAAMRARDKARLGVIRMALAAIKQREVDERIELDDTQVLSVLDKMVKQRRDSMEQFDKAGRDDLATQERQEIEVIESWLPSPLTDAEIDVMVAAAIKDSGAESMRDMGKAMALLKPLVAGRADMGSVSAKVKAALS